MQLHDTPFYLSAAPLPASFAGDPQAYFEAMLARTKIVSPLEVTTFVSGSVKPSNNQGPWLKNGTQWWVWDDDEADYVALDISASENQVYFVQEEQPEVFSPPLWFKTSEGAFVNVYLAISNVWVPLFVTSGTTAQRPTDPFNLQRYYDTDISCEIWWERGQWRTSSGVRGDVKFVSWTTAEDALLRNPGWEILGTSESVNEGWRGRVIGQATMNPGENPTTDLSTSLTSRARGDLVGSETHTLTSDEIPSHTHSVTGAGYNAGAAVTRRVLVDDSNNGTLHTVNPGTGSTGGGEAHNNMPPTLYLWTLRKT